MVDQNTLRRELERAACEAIWQDKAVYLKASFTEENTYTGGPRGATDT